MLGSTLEDVWARETVINVAILQHQRRNHLQGADPCFRERGAGGVVAWDRTPGERFDVCHHNSEGMIVILYALVPTAGLARTCAFVIVLIPKSRAWTCGSQPLMVTMVESTTP